MQVVSSHAVQEPFFLSDKLAWIFFLFSCIPLFPVLSFLCDASIGFPTAMCKDKARAIFLLTPSDKLQISHFCGERLPEFFKFEAIFLSFLMKYDLIPVGFVDLILFPIYTSVFIASVFIA